MTTETIGIGAALLLVAGPYVAAFIPRRTPLCKKARRRSSYERNMP